MKKIIRILFIGILMSGLLQNAQAQYSYSFTAGHTLVDHGTRSLSGNVNIPEPVNKLTVHLDITHTWINDLEVTVINPDGIQAVLFSRLGDMDCFGCDGNDLILDFKDSSNRSYSVLNESCEDGPAYSGESRPMESLDALLAGTINGEWIINIKDFWPFETGMVNVILFEFDNYTGPDCTGLIQPFPGATDVPVNTMISWNEIQGAYGYYLSLGTSAGSYDLVDKMDAGSSLSYDPGLLECGQEYFVKITPYNEYGEAGGCSDQGFTTEFVEAGSSGDVQICLGDSVVLSGYGGSVYEWSPLTYLNQGDSAAPVCKAKETTQYTVIVSNDRGCRDTSTLTVSVEKINYVIDSVIDYRIGLPGAIYLSVEGDMGNFIYDWNGPNGYHSSSQDIEGLEIGCYNLLITNSMNGCTEELTTCVDDLTNLSGGWTAGDIEIFPNPTDDRLFIYLNQYFNSQVEWSIFSMDGKNHYRETSGNGINFLSIDTKQLDPGFYIFHIKSENSANQLLFQVFR